MRLIPFSAIMIFLCAGFLGIETSNKLESYSKFEMKTNNFHDEEEDFIDNRVDLNGEVFFEDTLGRIRGAGKPVASGGYRTIIDKKDKLTLYEIRQKGTTRIYIKYDSTRIAENHTRDGKGPYYVKGSRDPLTPMTIIPPYYKDKKYVIELVFQRAIDGNRETGDFKFNDFEYDWLDSLDYEKDLDAIFQNVTDFETFDYNKINLEDIDLDRLKPDRIDLNRFNFDKNKIEEINSNKVIVYAYSLILKKTHIHGHICDPTGPC